MSEWRRFGEEIARAEDEILRREGAVERARDGFLEQAAAILARGEGERRGGGRLAVFGLAAAAVVLIAVAAVAVLHLRGAGTVLAATVDGPGNALRTGEWIASPPGGARRIDFSDGSRISLEPSSEARVVNLTADGARVFLERGTARVAVHKRPGAHWEVDVGPYAVSVKGTRFSVAWEPVRQAFTLSLEEGSVFVRGPLLQDGRLVAVSETLRAYVAEGRLEIASGGELPAADVVTPPAAQIPVCAPGYPGVDRAEPRTYAPAATAPATPADRGSPAPRGAVADGGWRELALAGRNREAIAAAEARGLRAVLAEAPAQDLVLLGDAARLGRDFGAADQCYRAVRARFPGRQEAADAAFALGRLDFDHRRLYAEAARWMAVYLAESPPDAVLAREALGRLIEAAQKAGDVSRAKAAAERYLAAYPDGPHAELARRAASAGSGAAADPTP